MVGSLQVPRTLHDGQLPAKDEEMSSSARATPAFRADQVGSLLRSKRLKDARAQREQGVFIVQQLNAVEDQEITALIKKQEDIGLEPITDGEYRRSWWHFDFLAKLDGVEQY
jgi:5-methyltetrahydropteroyltriglutamate--homocysteine methyltransferase